MIFYATSGILMAWVLFIIMARINLRRFLGYPAVLDAGATLLLAVLLHGTLGGMLAAISGGLFLSLMITVFRYYIGYERFDVNKRKWILTKGVIVNKLDLTKRFWPVIVLFILGIGVSL